MADLPDPDPVLYADSSPVPNNAFLYSFEGKRRLLAYDEGHVFDRVATMHAVKLLRTNGAWRATGGQQASLLSYARTLLVSGGVPPGGGGGGGGGGGS